MCKVPLCESKCEKSKLHQFECPIFAKRNQDLDEGLDFQEFELIVALRFLLWKKKDPEVYKQLKSLCSNKTEKVTPPKHCIDKFALRKGPGILGELPHSGPYSDLRTVGTVPTRLDRFICMFFY